MTARISCMMLLVCSAAYGEEWSRFRGPNGTGVSLASSLPGSLSPESNIIWRTPVPAGKSSPITFSDKVCVTGADGEERLVLCYRRSDGEFLWKGAITASRQDSRNPRNSPTSPTPASDGSNIYAFFPEYGIVSYDEEGKRRWNVPLGPFSVLHGMASSLALAGGNVVLVADQAENSFIAAYDQESGARRWHVPRLDGPMGGYATPAVRINENGEEEIVVSGVLTLTGYTARDGAEVWSLAGMNAQPKASPIVAGDRVYLASVTTDVESIYRGAFERFAKLDANEDGKLTQDELDGRAAMILNWFDKFWDGDDGVVALDAWSELARKNEEGSGLYAVHLDESAAQAQARVAWKVTRSLPQVPTPILYEGLLYMVRDGGIVTAIDPESGEIVKRARLRDAIDSYYASPVAGDGKLYFISESGKASVVQAGSELRVLSTEELDEACYATPAIADSQVFIRTEEALYSFGGSNDSSQ